MKKDRIKPIIGWTTLIITFAIISFWSYWGINEAFHEGWYHTSLWQNLSLTFVQYLSIPLIFLIIALVALNYKKIGSLLFVLLAIFTLFFFKSNAGRFLILIPLILLGLGFYFGQFKYKKLLTIILIIIPLLIILSFGIPQLIKVENRFNDNYFGMQNIEGNNINLTWAGEGFGFPLDGEDWNTAKSHCAKLNEKGDNLEDGEVNVWRLPTRNEIVRSLTRGNKNSGGFLDESGNTNYKINPDKETPLWNPNSKIIYYWTSDEKDEKEAYLVSYNGYVLYRSKTSGANYQGYRCVK